MEREVRSPIPDAQPRHGLCLKLLLQHRYVSSVHSVCHNGFVKESALLTRLSEEREWGRHLDRCIRQQEAPIYGALRTWRNVARSLRGTISRNRCIELGSFRAPAINSILLRRLFAARDHDSRVSPLLFFNQASSLASSSLFPRVDYFCAVQGIERMQILRIVIVVGLSNSLSFKGHKLPPRQLKIEIIYSMIQTPVDPSTEDV